jgi:hypothetical protein
MNCNKSKDFKKLLGEIIKWKASCFDTKGIKFENTITKAAKEKEKAKSIIFSISKCGKHN